MMYSLSCENSSLQGSEWHTLQLDITCFVASYLKLEAKLASFVNFILALFVLYISSFVNLGWLSISGSRERARAGNRIRHAIMQCPLIFKGRQRLNQLEHLDEPELKGYLL